jgi:hypothetical protein
MTASESASLRPKIAKGLAITAGILFIVGFIGSLAVLIVRLIAGVMAVIFALIFAAILYAACSSCTGEPAEPDTSEYGPIIITFLVSLIIGGVISTTIYLVGGILLLLWQRSPADHRTGIIVIGTLAIVLGSIGYITTLQMILFEGGLIFLFVLVLLIPLIAAVLSIVSGIVAQHEV